MKLTLLTIYLTQNWNEFCYNISLNACQVNVLGIGGVSFNIIVESVVCLAYCMYSLSCGILVYKLVTSRDSSIALSGTLVLSMKLMESVDCISP